MSLDGIQVADDGFEALCKKYSVKELSIKPRMKDRVLSEARSVYVIG